MTPNPAMQPPVLAFGEHSPHTLRVLGAADFSTPCELANWTIAWITRHKRRLQNVS
jgi:hypothetical protein